jgi:hypothetical protein
MADERKDDDGFDSEARRILRNLPVPEFAPVRPARRDFLRRGLAVAAGLATLGATGWVTASYAATPRIVRLSAAHGAEEETLRGVLVPDMAPVLQALSLPAGQAFPGILQLCKNCAIGPYPAWHIDAFLDDLGTVQVFVFRAPVPDASGQGWWFGQHWRFLPGAERFPVLLLAHRQRALAEMAARLQHTA